MMRRKGIFVRGIAFCLLLALCVSALSVNEAEAASRPKKPSFTVTKRTKTTATIKIKKKDKVTGYHVFVKKGKKGKYRLWTFSFKRTFKIKKLKPGSEYYVKIRAYRTRRLSIMKGKFSGAKKIKKYKKPSPKPTVEPSMDPSAAPTTEPTAGPSSAPTAEPTAGPSSTPTTEPTAGPSAAPTAEPSSEPAPSPSADPSDSSVQKNYAQQVLELVNEERAKEGKSPLALDQKLCEAAAVRAEEIVSQFSHTRPDGTACFTALKQIGISYRTAGENIAAGQSTPAAVMDSWMHSEGHRANIMSSDFGKLGVGFVQAPEGYQYYWVQMFTD